MNKSDKSNPSDQRQQLAWLVQDFLGGLPETQQRVFVQKHFQGWDQGRIARGLQCEASEVGRMLGRAELGLLVRVKTFLNSLQGAESSRKSRVRPGNVWVA